MPAMKDMNTKTLKGNVSSREAIMTRNKLAQMRQKQTSLSTQAKSAAICQNQSSSSTQSKSAQMRQNQSSSSTKTKSAQMRQNKSSLSTQTKSAQICQNESSLSTQTKSAEMCQNKSSLPTQTKSAQMHQNEASLSTQNKSAQMCQKESSSSDLEKDWKIAEDKQKKTNNKKRKIENKQQIQEQDRTLEYVPETVKRKIPSNKVVLKPKNCLKTVVTLDEYKKRKPISPKKTVLEDVVDDNMCVDVVSKVDDSAAAPSANDQTPAKIPDNDDEYKNLTLTEIIMLKEETEEITEDDLMEILTCPSPVWWEDPPNESYVEDPISIGGSTGPQGSAIKSENLSDTDETLQINSNDSSVLTPTNPELNAKSNILQAERLERDRSEGSRKCGRTSLKKRSTLQDVLDKLKKTADDSVKCDIGEVKKNKTETIDKPKKVKRIKSRDVLPQVPLDVLKDLENFEIPTAKSARNNLVEVKECIVIDDEEEDRDDDDDISNFLSVEFHEQYDNKTCVTETDNPNQAMNESCIIIPTINSNTKNVNATSTTNADSENVIKCTVEKNTEWTTQNDKIDNPDIQKHKNNKIIIKRSATIKPQNFINIQHSGVINNVQSPGAKIFFPFNKFFLNNAKKNCEKSEDVQHDVTLRPLGNSIPIPTDKQSNHKKVQNENEVSSNNIKTSTQSKEFSILNVTDTTVEHVRGSQHTSPQHLDSDMKISKDETNKMVKKAYLDYLNQNNHVNMTSSKSHHTKDISMLNNDSALKSSGLSQSIAKRILKIHEISKVNNNNLMKDICVNVSTLKSGGDQKIILAKQVRRNDTNTITNNIETIEINRDLKTDDKFNLCRSIQINENGEINEEKNDDLKKYVRDRLEQIMGKRGLVTKKFNSEKKNQIIPSKRLEESLDIPYIKSEISSEETNYNILRNSIEPDINKSTSLKENFNDLKENHNKNLKNVEEKTEPLFTDIEEPSVKKAVPNTVNLYTENKKLNQNHYVVSDGKVGMATKGSDRDMEVQKINGTDIKRQMKINKNCATISTLENESFSGNASEVCSESRQPVTVCKDCRTKHESIAVTDEAIVKYCFVCSSIFVSDDCNYCITGGNKVTFPTPHSCHLCKCLCCCLESLISHLRSHLDVIEISSE